MFANLTGWHFLILALIVVLIFGATKLPALAKSVGQSMKIFRNEIKTNGDAEATPEAAVVADAAKSAHVEP